MQSIINGNNEVVEKKNDKRWDDDGVGVKVQTIMCASCKNKSGINCNAFNCSRWDVPVSIYNCPKYEKGQSMPEKASMLLGVDVNGK